MISYPIHYRGNFLLFALIQGVDRQGIGNTGAYGPIQKHEEPGFLETIGGGD